VCRAPNDENSTGSRVRLPRAAQGAQPGVAHAVHRRPSAARRARLEPSG